MPQDFVAYRRDLPGGRTVMITLDEHTPSAVVGRLMLERRTDPARRAAGEPPIVAEVRGTSRGEVLASLKSIAESEGEVGRRLEAWLASRRTAEQQRHEPPEEQQQQQQPPPPGQRVRMPDGTWWSVEQRRQETARGAPTGRQTPAHGRALSLWFHGGDGALRQATVPGDFLLERASSAELQALWSQAAVVR